MLGAVHELVRVAGQARLAEGTRARALHAGVVVLLDGAEVLQTMPGVRATYEHERRDTHVLAVDDRVQATAEAVAAVARAHTKEVHLVVEHALALQLRHRTQGWLQRVAVDAVAALQVDEVRLGSQEAHDEVLRGAVHGGAAPEPPGLQVTDVPLGGVMIAALLHEDRAHAGVSLCLREVLVEGALLGLLGEPGVALRRARGLEGKMSGCTTRLPSHRPRRARRARRWARRRGSGTSPGRGGPARRG